MSPMSDDPVSAAGDDPDLKATSEGVGTTTRESGILGNMVERGGYLFAAGIVAAAIILLIEVFLRYVLNNPTLWVHETSVFLCGIAFIYGGLYCASRDSHIRVVLIYDSLGPRWRRIFDIAIYFVSAVAALFFAWASWLMVERAFWAPDGRFRMEGTGSAWNPPTPALMKGFLFVIMIVLAVQFVVLAVNHMRRVRKPSSGNR